MTTLSGALVTEPAISEKEWSRILARIEDGKVIPVIGEHLAVMSGGDPPMEMTLAGYLARQLDLPEPPTASLNEIAARYLQKNPGGTEDLFTNIFQSLPRAEPLPLPTPLKQLAEIRHFNLYVTTSFDPYMARALNEVRFGRRSSHSTRVLSYERNRSVDLPERFTELDYPLVYLFGKAQAAPIFAVTHEDVLELVHTLQAPERFAVPPGQGAARATPPGARHAPDRLAHAVLPAHRLGQRLRGARRSDYVIDPATSADAEQSLFFEQFGEAKLLPMSPVHFVEELAQRWRARYAVHSARDAARTYIEGELDTAAGLRSQNLSQFGSNARRYQAADQQAAKADRSKWPWRITRH